MKSILTTGTAAFALAMALGGGASAHAAEPEANAAEPQAAEAAPSVPDIIVTAQRRKESAQSIPVAITAIGSEQIAKTGIVGIDNIATKVPNFYFGSFGAVRPQLYIRGIGTRSFDPGSESSVGVFVDDVYYGRSSGSFGAMKDIERIEVLRGPQGTLYGRNTIGGAINVITKAPTDHWTGDFEAGGSNYNGWNLFGAVGGPIAGDKVTARVAAWTTQRDGYSLNLATGHRFQGVDNTGGRLRVTLKPTDGLKIDLGADFMIDGNKGAFAGFNQGTSANPNAVFFANPAFTATPAQSLYEGYLSHDPVLSRHAQTYSAKVDYALEDLSITSITSYRHLHSYDGRELEGSSLDVLQQLTRERSNQLTQEVRLTSAPSGHLSFGGKLDWIVGFYYYHDSSSRIDTFPMGQNWAYYSVTTSATDVAGSIYGANAWAFFGQAAWHITDKLTLTLGGRYSNDKKWATQSGSNTNPGLPLIPVPFATTNRIASSSTDPRVVIDYKINRDVKLYASYSTGYKGGGFQYIPFSLAVANTTFRPETLTAYEAGFKSDWFGRALRVNGSLFWYDYKNLQVARIIGSVSSATALIDNAASSTIKGVELEIVAHPTAHTTIGGSYGYLDAKYDNFVYNASTDFSNTTMVRSPKHSFSVNAEQTIPLGGNKVLTLRADYSYMTRFFHEPGQGELAYGVGTPLTAEGGYGLLNFRAGVDIGALRITGFVTNATDTAYRRTILYLPNGSSVGFAGEPRMYGGSIGYHF
ncbi:TonB-dependent receptor [Novosphingobium nitrogenifigens]|nr:TonB-dependent receptor [Novosphingobium nitrogenifigens]